MRIADKFLPKLSGNDIAFLTGNHPFFFLLFVPLVIFTVFTLGISIKALSLGIAILTMIVLARGKFQNEASVDQCSEQKLHLLSTLYLLAICVYPFVLFADEIARWHLGLQEVDFGIFSQIVDSVARKGDLYTSLVGTHWYHFLTHHFSPFFYVPGLMATLGLKAEFALLLLHSLAVGSSLLGLFLLSYRRQRSFFVAATLVLLILIHPAPRAALLSGVRDEIFGLPFLIFAYLTWSDEKHLVTCLLLVCAMTCKETMFLATSGFAIMALAYPILGGKKLTRSSLVLYISLAFCGLVFFILYTNVLARSLFWPTFSGYARISTIEQLLELKNLRQKVWWFITVLGPFLPLLAVDLFFLENEEKIKRWTIYRQRIVHLLVSLFPAAPFFGAILISNFEMMYQPYYYYSVLPTWLFLVALQSSLTRVASRRRLVALICACVFAAAWGSPATIISDVHAALTQDSPVTKLRTFISPEAVVIADEHNIPFFIRQRQVIRTFVANTNLVKFDFIVQRKSNPTVLSRYLRSWSRLCYEDDFWMVRCALERVKPIGTISKLVPNFENTNFRYHPPSHRVTD